MRKVLITGSSGFVGQNLLRYLSDYDFDCQAFSLRNMDWSISLPECGSVIHLAGKAHDLKNVAQLEEYYKVNFELTRQLYDSFLKSESKKFIFISSVKAVADHSSDWLTEDHKPTPQTHYGKSKLMAEEYIQAQKLPSGKSYYILRPCMIHGPGNKGNLNLLYNFFVSKGCPYPLASFDNKRSFLSVENLCFVIKELINRSDIYSGVFNLADSEALSTNEVLTTLSMAAGKSPRLLFFPRKFIVIMAKIGDTFKLTLNTEKLAKLTDNYIVSNKKIKTALNKDLPITALQGILKTGQSFTEK